MARGATARRREALMGPVPNPIAVRGAANRHGPRYDYENKYPGADDYYQDDNYEGGGDRYTVDDLDDPGNAYLRRGKIDADDAMSRKGDIDQMVRAVAAQLMASGIRDEDPTELYDLLHANYPIAAERVAIAKQQSGKPWSSEELNIAFMKELTAIGTNIDPYEHGALGERLMAAVKDDPRPISHTVGLVGPGPGGGPGGRPPLRSQVGEVDIRKKNTTVLNINSSTRDRHAGPLPNYIKLSVSGSNTFGLYGALQNVHSVTLKEINVNSSPLFTERPNGAPFYIRIREIASNYNRQSDGLGINAQFKCYALPDVTGSEVSLHVLSPNVSFPVPISSILNLTLEFLDEEKLPLVVEQDIYDIKSWVWNDTLARLEFEVVSHSIRNGDRLTLRGISLVEDANFFNIDHRFRATVLDLTHIAIDAHRFAPRTIQTEGAIIIDLNNVMRATLDVVHEGSSITAQ